MNRLERVLLPAEQFDERLATNHESKQRVRPGFNLHRVIADAECAEHPAFGGTDCFFAKKQVRAKDFFGTDLFSKKV